MARLIPRLCVILWLTPLNSAQLKDDWGLKWGAGRRRSERVRSKEKVRVARMTRMEW